MGDSSSVPQDTLPLGAIPLFATGNPDYSDAVTKMVAKTNQVYHEFLRSEDGLGFNGQVSIVVMLYEHHGVSVNKYFPGGPYLVLLNSHLQSKSSLNTPLICYYSHLVAVRVTVVSVACMEVWWVSHTWKYIQWNIFQFEWSDKSQYWTNPYHIGFR